MSLTSSVRAARTRSIALTGLLAAGATTAVLAASPAHAASDPFAALRQCESSGNYSINTGNGFYGAYQFDLATWRGLGYSGLPSAASPATQDAAARKLQAQRGWSPWPACSKKLGLSGTPAPAASSVAADVAASRSQPAESSRSATRTAAPASSSSAVFTVKMSGQVRDDVRVWQQQMNSLGYHLVVDGRYGRACARATSDFERQHGLVQERVGIVGPQVRAMLAKLVG